MDMIEPTILSKVLDWLWIALSFGFVFVFKKLFSHDVQLSGHETAIALCAQRDIINDKQRIEDLALRKQQRQEVLDQIQNHHEVMLKSINQLSDKIEKLR